METDHQEPASGLQPVDRVFEGGVESIEFPVHSDPKRLKGTRGRMNRSVASWAWVRLPDQVRQLGGRADWAGSAGFDDPSGDPSAVTLLTEFINEIGQIALGQSVEELGCGWRLGILGVEPHIEGPFTHETEAPLVPSELIR